MLSQKYKHPGVNDGKKIKKLVGLSHPYFGVILSYKGGGTMISSLRLLKFLS